LRPNCAGGIVLFVPEKITVTQAQWSGHDRERVLEGTPDEYMRRLWVGVLIFLCGDACVQLYKTTVAELGTGNADLGCGGGHHQLPTFRPTRWMTFVANSCRIFGAQI